MGLKFRSYRALSSDGNRSLIVVICNYQISPITVDTIPDANFIFTTRVDPISAPPEFVIEPEHREGRN